jgi:N6-adenosine-specific RNA methylase IME4
MMGTPTYGNQSWNIDPNAVRCKKFINRKSSIEPCLLSVRGRPVVNPTNQTTIIHGKIREHSRKPEEFYQIEALCPGSKLELFAREARPGWAAHGLIRKTGA